MAGVKRTETEKEELKRKVIDVAMEAFSRSGIRSVHMDEIAAMVFISKRTLYELFHDKEQLLLEVFIKQHQEMEKYIAEVASRAENVLEVLFAFYKRQLVELAGMNQQFFRDLRKYPKVLDYIHEYRKAGNEDALAYFLKGVDEGIFRNDINFSIINQAMSMQLDMLIFSDITENYPLADIYSEITVLHMRGITTEKGMCMIDDFLKQVKEKQVK